MWIRVGVLSGLEHLTDGHVYHSDKGGIKVCWSAGDSESGITAIQYSVGTSKGLSIIKIFAHSIPEVFNHFTIILCVTFTLVAKYIYKCKY